MDVTLQALDITASEKLIEFGNILLGKFVALGNLAPFGKSYEARTRAKQRRVHVEQVSDTDPDTCPTRAGHGLTVSDSGQPG